MAKVQTSRIRIKNLEFSNFIFAWPFKVYAGCFASPLTELPEEKKVSLNDSSMHRNKLNLLHAAISE